MISRTGKRKSRILERGTILVVVSPAVLPDRPVSPNLLLNVASAFAVGLLAALGIAFLLDYLDQSIKSDEELTERVGLIAVGHIAFVAAGQGKGGELVTLDASSHASEAYKALRTSLLFCRHRSRAQSDCDHVS